MKDKFFAGEEVAIKFKVGKVTDNGVFIYPVGCDTGAGQWFYKSELKGAIVEAENEKSR